jgi:hypothetical protein
MIAMTSPPAIPARMISAHALSATGDLTNLVAIHSRQDHHHTMTMIGLSPAGRPRLLFQISLTAS